MARQLHIPEAVYIKHKDIVNMLEAESINYRDCMLALKSKQKGGEPIVIRDIKKPSHCLFLFRHKHLLRKHKKSVAAILWLTLKKYRLSSLYDDNIEKITVRAGLAVLLHDHLDKENKEIAMTMQSIGILLGTHYGNYTKCEESARELYNKGKLLLTRLK